MHDEDLQGAIGAGFWLLPVYGMGGVELRGRVLRYDTALPWRERQRLVFAAIEAAEEAPSAPLAVSAIRRG